MVFTRHVQAHEKEYHNVRFFFLDTPYRKFRKKAVESAISISQWSLEHAQPTMSYLAQYAMLTTGIKWFAWNCLAMKATYSMRNKFQVQALAFLF